MLGTDRFGRSVLVRVLLGGAVSLGIGVAAAILAVVIGTLVGAIAGFVGGRVGCSVDWHTQRSEERCVGKESRSRWSAYHEKSRRGARV